MEAKHRITLMFHKSEIAFTCYINIKINQTNIYISSALMGHNKSVGFCSSANFIYLLFFAATLKDLSFMS